MFVMRTMREGDTEATVEPYFNPELTKVSQETDMMKEGCLSFPDIYLMIKRSAIHTLRKTFRKRKFLCSRICLNWRRREIKYTRK